MGVGLAPQPGFCVSNQFACLITGGKNKWRFPSRNNQNDVHSSEFS